MAGDVLLIGVDGGATEAKAHVVTCDDLKQPQAFALSDSSASRIYPASNGFTPVPVTEQLAQRDQAADNLTADERERGESWVQSAADAIIELAKERGATQILVGMGMPGLKTADGRGIAVINNGPRIPTFLASLETIVQQAGIQFAGPVAALGSDADYCGLGEAHASDGLFRGVENAYYVGCGTGIADALKLRGELVPFDAIKPWMMKAWQIPSAFGPTFEKLVAAKSFNDVYERLCAASGKAAGENFPEQDAAGGDAIAEVWLQTAAMLLSELIFERLSTIHSGRMEGADRGDAYSGLESEHTYRGIILDRVVIGQRLGIMFANEAYATVFRKPLERQLANFIANSGNAELAKDWLTTDGSLADGRLVASKLREAPALGAAVAAVFAHQA